MANENLLEISYQRVIGSEPVTLTTGNCSDYGYNYTTKTIDGVQYTVFYEKDKDNDNFIVGEDGLPTNKITNYLYQDYRHIAPPCSKYQISYADVDKEGSGRNSLTGEMFRERIGSYSKLDVAWDLIPNSKEYNNWYKILTSLPPFVTLKMLKPNGEIQEKTMYRGDISTNLYLFVKNYQIWQGLSTTFTDKDVQPYDDTKEMTTQYNIQNRTTGETKVVYDFEWEDYYSTISDWVKL